MTCEKCGHKEVFYKENSENSILRCCPVCDKLRVLSKEESRKLIESQYQYFDRIFIDYIKKFNKKSLIVWLLGYREELASKFITESPSIKLNEFLSINIMIKRVMEKYNENGLMIANKEIIKELLSFYIEGIEIKENEFVIEEDFGYFISNKDFQLEHFDTNKLFSNFRLVYDEDWMTVIKSFNQNFIMTGESAEKYMEENREKYERNKIKPSKATELTIEENIHTLYDVLQSFKVGLTKNSLFAKTFNFNYLENKNVLIELFPKLTEYFDFKFGMLRVVRIEEFKQFLSEEFGELNQSRLYTDLVFSYDNQDVFPFFVELKNVAMNTEGDVEDNNIIFISRSLFSILGIFYYPFYYKKLFDRETQLLSDQLEKIDVPKKFYENGFNVRVNIEKKYKREKKLEIDTIAWNNNTIYVIETKLWDVNKFFEQRRVHNERERDLKGIVDGYKFTNGIPKEIPSLIYKINYVKENFVKILSDYEETAIFPDHDIVVNNTDKKIVGLIVTKSYPPIKEYKEVRMIGFKELNDL